MTVSTQQLIAANMSAPADTVIREIFKHFTNVRDDGDSAVLATVQEALELWYGLDVLVLVFDKKDGDHTSGRCDFFVRLIHQHSFQRPSVEDISDYSTSLEDHPDMKRVLDANQYALIYGGGGQGPNLYRQAVEACQQALEWMSEGIHPDGSVDPECQRICDKLRAVVEASPRSYKKLSDFLDVLEEEFEFRMDTVDGDDGQPQPNEAMMIFNAIGGQTIIDHLRAHCT